MYTLEHEAIVEHAYLDNLKPFWHTPETLTGREADLIHYPNPVNPFFIEELDETW